MRFEIVKAVFLKELRETLRDRRSLIMMFGIPLVLYPLLALGLGSLGGTQAKKTEEQLYDVAVVNADGAPHLIEQIESPESGLRIAKVDDPDAALARRAADAVLVLPEKAEATALESKDVTIRIDVDRSRREAGVIERKVHRTIGEYQQWIIKKRLERRNVPDTVLRPIFTETRDVASGSQRLGRILAGLLPNLLLITGALGAFFPALNATTTERESGTLETLLVTPASKVELLIGKGTVVLLSSLLTAALNLVSMSLVMWRLMSSMVGEQLGSMTISPQALVLTFIATVPTLIFFSALVLIIGLFSRSFREANSYATPVMLLPLLSLVVSIVEPPTTIGILMTPIVNAAVVTRDVLTARVSAGSFLLAFGSSCFYAALMLSAAARTFTSEQLVSPTWEPVSLRGLRRRAKGARRIPAIDEAGVLFAVVLLLLFYVSESLAKHGLFAVLFGNELLLITAPTLLFAWFGQYDWREVFSLRGPTVIGIAAAILMGVGLALGVDLLTWIQAKFWEPPQAAMKQQAEVLIKPLIMHPELTVLCIGAAAGICEELLFRGPIQSALGKRMKLWPTILLGSFLFAFVHLDFYGLPLRLILSLPIAWIVWRGGSIFAAMLMHGLYDAVRIGMVAWEVRGMDYEQVMRAASAVPASLPASAWIRIGIGMGLFAAGWLIAFKMLHREEDQVGQSSPATGIR